MERRQFRILYRQFLFRLADVEALSAHAQGDSNKLLGQFASLLILASVVISLPALGPPRGVSRLAFTIASERFLVATTMLVTGLFAVLCWDTTFPDRRDVLTLAPLPVRARTLFLAKAAAVGTALAMTIGMLHVVAGIVWPVALSAGSGIFGWFVAYWVTMLAAGGFVFCCVLALQGVAAQFLPRRLFLRASGWLQMAAFCFFVGEYFLGRLGHVAWPAFGIAAAVAALSYAMAYVRTLRQIVEAPEIAPAAGGLRRLPRFGGPLATAVVQFSIRTLMRSRQHRLILAFYLGVSFALTILLLRTPVAASAPLFTATILTMGLAVAGMRVVFSLPLDLRANWLFRVTPVEGGAALLRARRRALLALAVAPVWAGSVAASVWMLPRDVAAGHAVVLGPLGMVVAEVALNGPVKVPFTCSYLPGKSNLHVTFWMCVIGVGAVVAKTAQFELWALGRAWGLPGIAGGLVVVLFVLKCAKDPVELRFEEEPPDAVVELRLSGI